MTIFWLYKCVSYQYNDRQCCDIKTAKEAKHDNEAFDSFAGLYVRIDDSKDKNN